MAKRGRSTSNRGVSAKRSRTSTSPKELMGPPKPVPPSAEARQSENLAESYEKQPQLSVKTSTQSDNQTSQVNSSINIEAEKAIGIANGSSNGHAGGAITDKGGAPSAQPLPTGNERETPSSTPSSTASSETGSSVVSISSQNSETSSMDTDNSTVRSSTQGANGSQADGSSSSTSSSASSNPDPSSSQISRYARGARKRRRRWHWPPPDYDPYRLVDKHWNTSPIIGVDIGSNPVSSWKLEKKRIGEREKEHRQRVSKVVREVRHVSYLSFYYECIYKYSVIVDVW